MYKINYKGFSIIELICTWNIWRSIKFSYDFNGYEFTTIKNKSITWLHKKFLINTELVNTIFVYQKALIFNASFFTTKQPLWI